MRFARGDVAKAAGVGEKRLERDVKRGLVDRRDLESVVRYIAGQAGPAVSREARQAYLELGVALGIGLPGDSSHVLSADPDAREALQVRP